MLKTDETKKIIILSGGGTGGSVAPLLAIREYLIKKHPHWTFIWFGTRNGLEKEMVLETDMRYVGIFSGKLRRYFSIKNFIDFFKIIIAFWQSLIYLKKLSPNLVMSAGGFVSVPLAWAAKLLSIPVISHQQDVRAGLANKLMSRVASKMTVTFSESIKDYGEKAVLVGNPVRQAFKNLRNRDEIIESLNLKKDKPILSIVGGGQGSKKINDLVFQSISHLNKELQIIHITGSRNEAADKQNDYLSYNFISSEKMAEIMSVSDLLVSRCGLGFITELSFLQKTVIFIPMPFSHQEDNAKLISKHKAGLVLDQNNLSVSIFKEEILGLLKDKNRSLEMANNLYNLISKQAEEDISYMIEKYAK